MVAQSSVLGSEGDKQRSDPQVILKTELTSLVERLD